MSKTNKNIPELRFPEFVNDGEWKVVKLDKVLIKNSSKNKEGKHSIVETVSNKFGFINQEEYFENRRVASKNTSNYYIVKRGFFAYNPSRIDVGSLAYKNDDVISIISPLYISFKAENTKIVDWFLYYWFNSENFTKQIIFEGGVRNTLNFANLIQMEIQIPEISEQQKIASCLSSLDELITGEEQRLELLSEHKKGLMQNLFPNPSASSGDETIPKYRFPEFEKDGEWEEKTIEQVAKVTTGNKDTQNKVDDGEFPFFVRSQTVERINSFSYDGEAILTSGDGVGVGKNFHYINGKFDFHQRVYCIYEFEKEINGRFLFMYFSQFFYNRVMKMTAKNSVDSVRMAMITEMSVLLPTLQEQQKIASCLSSLDELIQAQTGRIEELKEHKKGLMQKLFPLISG